MNIDPPSNYRPERAAALRAALLAAVAALGATGAAAAEEAAPLVRGEPPSDFQSAENEAAAKRPGGFRLNEGFAAVEDSQPLILGGIREMPPPTLPASAADEVACSNGVPAEREEMVVTDGRIRIDWDEDDPEGLEDGGVIAEDWDETDDGSEAVEEVDPAPSAP